MSQSAPDRPHGDWTSLSLCPQWCGPAANSQRTAYLRFQVAIPAGNASGVTAVLQLTPQRTAAGVLVVRDGSAQGWDAATLDWNSRPVSAGAVIARQTLTGGTKPVSLDVTKALKADGSLSVEIQQISGNQIVFQSSESKAGQPQLFVDLDAAPQPPTPAPSATGSTPAPTGTPAPTTAPTTAPTSGPTATKGPPPTTSCNPLPITLPAPAALHATRKKAFAYYFPPFPLSTDNKATSADSYSRWLYSLNSTNGAYDLRDRPISRGPAAGNFTQADFELEVRRAVTAGLDGFIWEYHTSSDARWNQLPAMLAAVRAVDPGFRIMLSPDFDTSANSTSDSVVNDVLKVASDPSIYRLDDGRIVLAPFYPERKTPAWWDELHDRLADKGVNTALIPVFLSWGGGSEKSEWRGSVAGYSSWGTRTTSGTGTYVKNSETAHSQGKLWMSPVAFEDTRSYDGRFWESSNSSLMRSSLEKAIQSDADIVAFMTWNDYTESWVSPSQERGYAVTDVASYYLQWFKTGRAPTVSQDALYWFHRSQRTDAPFGRTVTGRKGQPITMKVPNGDPATNDVELVAFLTGPGRLVIRQGSSVSTLDAGAGVTSFKVPMVPGTTPAFQLQRSGTTVQTVTSDTLIRPSVPFQDIVYHAGGGIACLRP